MLFACIFVPDFPVAAIVRNEPELCGQAVAVVDGTPPLLKVVAANELARKAGVEIGMSKLQAAARLSSNAKLTPSDIAHIRHRSSAQETAAHDALCDCARAISPRVEDRADAPDTVLLDVAGLERLWGTPRMIAIELARRAAAFALDINVAIAANLEAAICAARGFAGVTVIEEGEVEERLASLSLEILLQSAQLGSRREREVLETFNRWGIRTFRAVAALPNVAVSERLGTEGVYLQKLARGQGTRTLTPTDPPAHFEEAIELEHAIEDLESLAFVMNRLIEQLCARLSARALSTNELRLRMELERCGECDENFTPFAARRMGNPPDGTRYERAIRLPVPMLDTKTFLRLWQLELRTNPPCAPVAKLWLSAEPVQPRFTQGGLFLPAASEPQRLEVTLARIAGIVRAKGAADQKDVRVGSAEVLDTHAPDAFRMKRFFVNADGGRKLPTSAPRLGETEEKDSRRAVTALRRVRPPVRISVEVQEGRPVRLRGARTFLPHEMEVTWCAGPWRISGDWWNQPWSRDEWDVAVDTALSQVFYRIYRDASDIWFVEGTYD
jgi:protein ImuB